MTETVVERSYDKEGKLELHRNLCEALSIKETELPDYLRELIQEIAFAIFQTGKDYINKNTLYKHKSPILQEFFQAVAKENYTPEDALKLLMMSFYIQELAIENAQDTQRETDDEIMSDYALEFLHHSLQEYLVAEYIGKEMGVMIEKRKRRPVYIINEGKKALELAWRLFAPRRIGEGSHQVVNYLIEIIQSQADNEKQVLAERLQEFLPYCLENNFLLEYNHQTQPKLSPLDLMQNTFYGYWTVFSYSNQNEILLAIQSKEYLANFLKIANYYHVINLRRLDLSGMNLSGANLSNVNLNKANLRGTILNGTNLTKVDLRQADLSKANLRQVDLSRADLRQVDLSEADLYGVNLHEANLNEADLRQTNLSQANLVKANLNKTDLRQANLRRANLKDISLIGADLTQTDLTQTDLSEIDLSKISLKGTDLSRAKLSQAQYDYAQAQGAILEDVQIIAEDNEG